MPIDIIGYINILIAFVNFLLGAIVLLSNSKKPVNMAYFYCTTTIGLWSLALYFYDNPVLFDSVAWLKIVYVISYLMTFAQIFFVIRFYGEISKKYLFLFLSLLTGLFSYGIYLLLVKESVILGTSFDANTQTVVADMGLDYVWYFIPILVSLVFLFYMHIARGNQQEGLKKKQSQYYWIAGFCMILPLLFFDFVLPVFFDNTMYYKYSALGNIAWSIIIAYSIYNTRFLDVRLVLGKFIEFIFKSLYIFIILFVFSSWLINNSYFAGGNLTFLLIYVSIICSILLNIVNLRTENIVQKKFIYSRYNPTELLQKYSSTNSEELVIEKILRNTKEIIYESVRPEKYSIFLFTDKGFFSQDSEAFDFIDKGTIIAFLGNWKSLNSNPSLISSEIDLGLSSGKEIIDSRKKAILEFMNVHKIEIIIPLELKTDVQGLLILGNKQDNSLYSAGDINFIEGMVKNLNIALGRSLLYKQLQSFNETLKSKVDEQTKELQVKVEELQEARRKERDMIDIMGHELRTPATIVKLNAGLMEKYIGSNPQDFKKYLDRIKDSIENEIKLINTLLTSAKLEGNRVEISNEKVDIVAEIDMVIHGHEREAEEKSIQLVNSVKDGTPAIYGDKVRTIEVLDNLIGNAVKYTKTGSVTVQTEYDADMVKVSIIDTGDGIPAEELPKLGNKFHRVGNYIESNEHVNIVRPGGTGLGLFVVFGLVRLMKGDIWVESEVGKGSKFIFTLPIYKDQEVTQSISGSKNMFERLGLRR